MQKSLEEINEMTHKRMMGLRDAEFATGASLVGPQKHDIIFLYGQKDSRFYCSQGQQRAIILSFKMAQIVYHRRVHGFYPALMLDDVLSELDESKRTALINFLHEINTQIFITTTDLSLPQSFALENYSVMEVKNGEVL
jgi:DNA replication and repair protein RecF